MAGWSAGMEDVPMEDEARGGAVAPVTDKEFVLSLLARDDEVAQHAGHERVQKVGVEMVDPKLERAQCQTRLLY